MKINVPVLSVFDENGRRIPIPGVVGESAYQADVKNGLFKGSEEEWLLWITPHIGENGNWWVRGTDTGVIARANVDDTLSLGGYAADALVTGEELRWMKEQMGTLGNTVYTMDAKARALAISPVASGERVFIHDAARMQPHEVRIFGKTVQVRTPTPEAPCALQTMGADGVILLTVSGKNLLDHTKITSKTGEFTDGLAGAVITPEVIDMVRQTEYDYAKIPVLLPAGAYTLSYHMEVYDRPADSTGITRLAYGISGNSIEFTVTGNGEYHKTVNFSLDSLTEVQAVVNANVVSAVPAKVRFRIMLVNGTYTEDNMPEFEPYKSMVLPVPTPNGLPGIPVTSGGNYTDSDGQQWVCDEIDLDGKRYIQRIGRRVLDGTENIVYSSESSFYAPLADMGLPGTKDYAECSCSFLEGTPKGAYNLQNNTSSFWANNWWIYSKRFTTAAGVKKHLEDRAAAGTPEEFMYQLAEPVNILLSDDVIDAYRKLYTYKPDTVVYTDEGAWLSVKYAADPKAYVDNKFNELAKIIISNT